MSADWHPEVKEGEPGCLQLVRLAMSQDAGELRDLEWTTYVAQHPVLMGRDVARQATDRLDRRLAGRTPERQPDREAGPGGPSVLDVVVAGSPFDRLVATEAWARSVWSGQHLAGHLAVQDEAAT